MTATPSHTSLGGDVLHSSLLPHQGTVQLCVHRFLTMSDAYSLCGTYLSWANFFPINFIGIMGPWQCSRAEQALYFSEMHRSHKTYRINSRYKSMDEISKYYTKYSCPLLQKQVTAQFQRESNSVCSWREPSNERPGSTPGLMCFIETYTPLWEHSSSCHDCCNNHSALSGSSNLYLTLC